MRSQAQGLLGRKYVALCANSEAVKAKAKWFACNEWRKENNLRIVSIHSPPRGEARLGARAQGVAEARQVDHRPSEPQLCQTVAQNATLRQWLDDRVSLSLSVIAGPSLEASNCRCRTAGAVVQRRPK
jgi:hypothetical protein